MKKWSGKIALLLFLLFILAFLLGPRAKFEKVNAALPELNIPLSQLDSHLKLKESLIDDLKPGTEGRIVWNDTTKQQTKYCLLYLHGFSATAEEGAPVHTEVAKHFGMNAYLPRLFDHGRKSKESFLDLTPANYMESAKEALVIASQLGEKVVIMGCSTGATLAVYLAAHYPDLIESLFLYSPNIDLYDSNSRMLLWPWGKQLFRKMEGGDYHAVNYKGSEGAKYWNEQYRIEGLIALKALISQTMTNDIFSKVKQSVLVCSYYKDEQEHDKVVSHEAMDRFFNSISTPKASKKFIKYPDVSGHVFSSHIFNDDYKKPLAATVKFIENVLGLRTMKSVAEKVLAEDVY